MLWCDVVIYVMWVCLKLRVPHSIHFFVMTFFLWWMDSWWVHRISKHTHRSMMMMMMMMMMFCRFAEVRLYLSWHVAYLPTFILQMDQSGKGQHNVPYGIYAHHHVHCEYVPTSHGASVAPFIALSATPLPTMCLADPFLQVVDGVEPIETAAEHLQHWQDKLLGMPCLALEIPNL